MWLRSWQDRLQAAPARRPAPRPPRERLFLERLEERDLLSGGESPTLVALGGATPRPIPLPLALAASPFNPPGLDIYQNFQGPADAPPPFGNEPNQITDFIGLYAGARVQGAGSGRQGNGPDQSFFWDADLRFMQGVYRGVNGQLYARTFIEVWLDVYGSQSDFVNHVNFTHDTNPGNGPAVSPVDSGNGFGTRVFWTAVIPDGDVQINPLTGQAQAHVPNLPLLDYYSPAGQGDLASLGPTWQAGYFASTVSLDVVWNGPVTRRALVRDAANGFAGLFDENQATVTWSESSQSGFRFRSGPGNFSTSVPEAPGVNGVTAPLNFFAQVGLERNGIFFGGEEGGDGAGVPVPPPASDRPNLPALPPPANPSGAPTTGSGLPPSSAVTGISGNPAGSSTDAAEFLARGPATSVDALDRVFAEVGSGPWVNAGANNPAL